MEGEAEDELILQVAECAAVGAHKQDHDKRRHAGELLENDLISVELTGWDEYELMECWGEGTDAMAVIGYE